ncbi:MAG: DUF4058 family protein [Bacteroidota bacterium]
MAEKKEPQVGMHSMLEQPRYFPDLHASLCVEIRYWLAPRLPAAYSISVNISSQPQRYLAIRDNDEQLITTIEILSPANKTGDGYEDFRRKQEHLAKQMVHLVELDLLTQGKRRWQDERVDQADYVMTVQRATSAIANVWATALGEALPIIPIPLCDPDADVPLPMERIFREYLTKSGLHRRLGRTNDVE